MLLGKKCNLSLRYHLRKKDDITLLFKSLFRDGELWKLKHSDNDIHKTHLLIFMEKSKVDVHR